MMAQPFLSLPVTWLSVRKRTTYFEVFGTVCQRQHCMLSEIFRLKHWCFLKALPQNDHLLIQTYWQPFWQIPFLMCWPFGPEGGRLSLQQTPSRRVTGSEKKNYHSDGHSLSLSPYLFSVTGRMSNWCMFSLNANDYNEPGLERHYAEANYACVLAVILQQCLTNSNNTSTKMRETLSATPTSPLSTTITMAISQESLSNSVVRGGTFTQLSGLTVWHDMTTGMCNV